MDNFSGDTEIPSKGSASKVVKETSDIDRDNFLSVLNSEHSKLPVSFSIGGSLQSGFDLLRKETLDSKVEIGGVLFKDVINEVKVHRISPTALNSDSLVGFGFYSLNESNIEHELRYYAEDGEKKSFFKTQVYFTDSALAQKYRYFFEKLIQDGKSVIVDGKPLAPIHSHPSGNLPSSGDFDHVLSPSGDGNLIPEVVLTEDWVYFLFPTRQTPDLSVGAFGEFKMKDPYEGIRNEEGEDRAAKHLLATSGKDSSEEHRNKALNAVRLKVITDKCLKYNVGFYALAKGESVAKRIA